MYKKNCAYCDTVFIATGPAGRYCEECQKLNKFVRIEKGIYYNEIQNRYKYNFKRDSSGNIHGDAASLEDARNILAELNNMYEKELNTGIFNNACRAGLISNQHNFRQFKLQLKSKPTFICERCKKEYDTRYYINVHHKDHNRDNDDYSNFEVLCTYCHREHHNKRGKDGKFISQGSTTIPSGSTLQANGSGSGVHDE